MAKPPRAEIPDTAETSALTDDAIRERQIDEQIDKDRDGLYKGKIQRRRLDETLLGYERRVSLEMTLILYPSLRKEFGGAEVNQFRDRERSQPDYWQALLNVPLFAMIRDRRGVTTESLREALQLRDRYAAQCLDIWGRNKPAPGTEFDGVMANMLAAIEGVLVADPAPIPKAPGDFTPVGATL